MEKQFEQLLKAAAIQAVELADQSFVGCTLILMNARGNLASIAFDCHKLEGMKLAAMQLAATMTGEAGYLGFAFMALAGTTWETLIKVGTSSKVYNLSRVETSPPEAHIAAIDNASPSTLDDDGSPFSHDLKAILAEQKGLAKSLAKAGLWKEVTR